MPLAKVNPCQAKRFAQATGTRIKTDKADAAMLATFGVLLKPQKLKPKSQTQYDLEEFLCARDGLIKDRTAILNLREKFSPKNTQTKCKSAFKNKSRDNLKKIDEAMLALIQDDPVLQNRMEILESIKGIGQPTAIALLVHMPELGTLEPRKAASLAGLAPITRESGNWKGKSFIQGGRAKIRTTFIHALSRRTPT